MQYKRSDIPAHDKNTQCKPNNSGAYSRYIAKIFGREKKGIGTEGLHQIAGNCSKKDIPKNKEHLVPAKMQQEKLHRQRAPKADQVFFHIVKSVILCLLLHYCCYITRELSDVRREDLFLISTHDSRLTIHD